MSDDEDLSYELKQMRAKLKKIFASRESDLARATARAMIVASRLNSIAAAVFMNELDKMGIEDPLEVAKWLLRDESPPKALGLMPFTMEGLQRDLEATCLLPDLIAAAQVRIPVPGMEDFTEEPLEDVEPYERRQQRNIGGRKPARGNDTPGTSDGDDPGDP